MSSDYASIIVLRNDILYGARPYNLNREKNRCPYFPNCNWCVLREECEMVGMGDE